nr:hypothetical protein [Tanacetum cinerariifolium]
LPTWHLDVYAVGFDGMVMFLLWGEEFYRGAGEEVKVIMNSRLRREGVLVCVISREFSPSLASGLISRKSLHGYLDE